MTKEEIEELKGLAASMGLYDDKNPCKRAVILGKAIKALEQKPCEDWHDVPSDEMTLGQARQAVKDLRKKLAEYLWQTPCKDAISRQAVIDMTGLSEWFDSSDSYNEFVIALSELPPVTPQLTEAEIQKMQELEQAEIQKAYELGKAEQPKTEKVIKMRDATPEERESIGKYIKSISKPTGVNFWNLDQEPKTGHWEWVQYDYNPKLGNWHCSECRSIAVKCVDKNEKGGIPLYKYCPNCGAKMVEPQESE